MRDHDRSTLQTDTQTDGRTTYGVNTALCSTCTAR